MVHTDSPNTRVAGPLEGLVVADFSRVLAAPLATMLLGDLGADVIKIEQPIRGDDTRAWGPPFTDDGISAYYLSVNRNKRSVALDLSDPGDLAVAKRIVKNADVVIENFRTGTMGKFGLDYETLRAEHAELIYCSVSGFGSSEPARDLAGYDFMIQALSGLMSITGEADSEPMKTGVAIVDVLTGLHATIGILAAMHERHASGRGQLVEVNLMSSALASLVNQASSYLTTGTVPSRMGNQHPSIAPYETFSTATTTLALAVGNDRQFADFAQALGAAGLAHDERFSTNRSRVEHRTELVDAVQPLLNRAPCADWISRLSDLGVPCAEVNSIDDAIELADRLGLDPIRRLHSETGTEVATVANPICFSRTAVTYRHPPPTLGSFGPLLKSWLAEKLGSDA